VVHVEISEEAEEMILGYVEWLEVNYSQGSGNRFLIHFDHFLNRLSKSYPYFSPCSNLILRSKGLYCTTYRQWILAFEIASEKIIIMAFIHKKRMPSVENPF